MVHLPIFLVTLLCYRAAIACINICILNRERMDWHATR